jgi:hypothetical protein
LVRANKDLFKLEARPSSQSSRRSPPGLPVKVVAPRTVTASSERRHRHPRALGRAGARTEASPRSYALRALGDGPVWAGDLNELAEPFQGRRRAFPVSEAGGFRRHCWPLRDSVTQTVPNALRNGASGSVMPASSGTSQRASGTEGCVSVGMLMLTFPTLVHGNTSPGHHTSKIASLAPLHFSLGPALEPKTCARGIAP